MAYTVVIAIKIAVFFGFMLLLRLLVADLNLKEAGSRGVTSAMIRASRYGKPFMLSVALLAVAVLHSVL